MSVEIEQKDQEVFDSSKAKRADRLRQYYFPTKENSNPTQQETGKTPRAKRPSIVSSIDPTQLPQVHSSSLGIDLEQLDSTISNNVESFINATLGEIGWTDTPELALGTDFSNMQESKKNSIILDDQCLELIKKAYKNNSIKVKERNIVAEEPVEESILSKMQDDFVYLETIFETVEAILPRNQLMDNLTEYCNQINSPESIKEYGRVCDIIRDLSQDLQQIENHYIEKYPENEAFALIAFNKLRLMNLSNFTINHINSLNEALNLYNSTNDNEKIKFIQKFIQFISQHL